MTDRTAESPVAAAAALAEATGVAAHDVAVMLGSGWRPAADLLGTPSHEIAMADLLGSCGRSWQGTAERCDRCRSAPTASATTRRRHRTPASAPSSLAPGGPAGFQNSAVVS